MVGGIDKVIYLPAMLTEQLGYFKDEGVDVTCSRPSPPAPAPRTCWSPARCRAWSASTTTPSPCRPRASASRASYSSPRCRARPRSSRPRPPARSRAPNDFTGRKLGVTSPGSSTDYLTQYLATKNGIDSDEYTTVTAGAGSTFIAALQNGGIDAGMTTDPTIATAVDQGLGKVLIDMRTEEGTKQALGGLYPAASMYMDCSYVKENPKTVQKLVDAFVKTMQWIHTTRGRDRGQDAEDYDGGNPALYEKSIKDSSPMFTTDGVMPDGGPQTVLDVLGTFSDVVKEKKDDIDLSKTYTTKFAGAAS